MLGADILLPGAGPGAGLAGEQRLQTGFCVQFDGERSHFGAGRGQCQRRRDAAWQARAGNLQGVRRRRPWWGRLLRNYPARSEPCREILMTTFQEARAFLLEHRTDYDAAVKGFRWPDPAPFNWALDWFDAELARKADS